MTILCMSYKLSREVGTIRYFRSSSAKDIDVMGMLSLVYRHNVDI